MKKTNIITWIGAACLLVAFAGALAGCLPVIAAGGTAGVREITDKVETYACNAKQAEAAVRMALKDLGARVKEVEREEEKGGDITLRGRTYDDEHLTVDIEPTSPNSVEIEIRVGRIGSKSRAKEFHTALKKYIK